MSSQIVQTLQPAIQQVLMVIPGAVANRTWQEVYLWGKVLVALGSGVTDDGVDGVIHAQKG